MSSATTAETFTPGPNDLDLSPFMQPGASEQAIKAGKELAGLWRQAITWVEVTGDPVPARRRTPDDLTPVEQQIVLTNREVRRGRIAAGVRPTPLAERYLAASARHQSVAMNRYSNDRDIANNYEAYVLDRLAFLAAWYSVHPPKGVK